MGTRVSVVVAALVTALASINAVRASYDLPVLAADDAATAYAVAWSQRMAETGALAHSPNLTNATTGWTHLGENVGVGPSLDAVLAGFMQSPPHRANMLGEWTHAGVGAVEWNGSVWVTVVFVLRSSPVTMTTTTATAATTTTLMTTTTTVVTPAPVVTTNPSAGYAFVQLPRLCKDGFDKLVCLW